MPPEKSEAFDAALETLLAFYALDVVIYPAPGWVPDAVCRGHDGMRQLGAVWTENVVDATLEVHEIRDLHDRLLILAEFTGRSKDSGAPISQPFGVVNSDLRDNGTVGEVRFFLGWQQAIEAVGLEP